MPRRSLLTARFLLAALACAAGIANANADEACAAHGLPVSRIVEVDADGGPLFGSITRRQRESSFLKPREVVLTFDDGPMPWVTKSILDTLDAYCTKAMFFSVGRMAITYPRTVRDILARGHTLGSHTFSHPLHMPHMQPEKATAEIERGLAAVSEAAGGPVTPFFRFTGLADSPALLAYLATRHMASFSVDTVSNDSYIRDPKQLIERTLAEVERKKGGIILFHDIKTATAKALPEILSRLKAKGYRVVQVTSAKPSTPDPALMTEYAPKVARAMHTPAATASVAASLSGTLAPEHVDQDRLKFSSLAPTPLAPTPRDRAKPATAAASDWSMRSSVGLGSGIKTGRQAKKAAPTTISGWSTVVNADF